MTPHTAKQHLSRAPLASRVAAFVADYCTPRLNDLDTEAVDDILNAAVEAERCSNQELRSPDRIFELQTTIKSGLSSAGRAAYLELDEHRSARAAIEWRAIFQLGFELGRRIGGIR